MGSGKQAAPPPTPPSAADEARRRMAEEAREQANAGGRNSTILTKGFAVGIPRPKNPAAAPRRTTLTAGL